MDLLRNNFKFDLKFLTVNRLKNFKNNLQFYEHLKLF